MSHFIYNNYLIGGAPPLILNQQYNLLTSTSSPDTNIDADGKLDNGKAFQNITITKIDPNKYLKHLTNFTLADPNNKAKSIEHDSRHNHYKLKTSGGKVNIVQIKDSTNSDVYKAPIIDAVLKAKRENDRKFVEQMKNKAIAQQNAAKQAAKLVAAKQAAAAAARAAAAAAKKAASEKLIINHANPNYNKGHQKPKITAKVHNIAKKPAGPHHNTSAAGPPQKPHHKPHHKPHGKPHHGKPHHQKPHQKPQSQSQFMSYEYKADPVAEAAAAREEAIKRNKARQKHKGVSYTYHA